MLFGKKKRIFEYLTEKQASQALTAFDTILSEYLSGSLKNKLYELSLKNMSIHIDWMADYKCINIQGKVSGYFFDIQIEPVSFSIAYDKDEPDDVTEFTLQDITLFYKVIEEMILKIK